MFSRNNKAAPPSITSFSAIAVDRPHSEPHNRPSSAPWAKQYLEAECGMSRSRRTKGADAEGLGVAAAAGAATTVVSGAAQAEVTVAKPEQENPSGYRETQHVRDYYDSL